MAIIRVAVVLLLFAASCGKSSDSKQDPVKKDVPSGSAGSAPAGSAAAGSGSASKESPPWAVALASKWKSFEVAVFAKEDPTDAAGHLSRADLGVLAGRVTYTAAPTVDALALRASIPATGFKAAVVVLAQNPVDALVAAQVLRDAWKGRAFALGPDGAAEELP